MRDAHVQTASWIGCLGGLMAASPLHGLQVQRMGQHRGGRPPVEDLQMILAATNHHKGLTGLERRSRKAWLFQPLNALSRALTTRSPAKEWRKRPSSGNLCDTCPSPAKAKKPILLLTFPFFKVFCLLTKGGDGAPASELKVPPQWRDRQVGTWARTRRTQQATHTKKTQTP